MKKLFVLFVLSFVGTVKADVSQKVVELHITRIVQEEETTPTRFAKVKKVNSVARQYVCSGSFIDSYGDVLTAKHCTEDIDSIDIMTSDNQIYHGTVVATSPLQDLALVHIDKLNTPYFVMASSVTQGDDISTIGSPLALTGTQSWGKVARLSGDLLFMDQSILPGNSGGAVFNKNEQLVGVAVSVAIVGFGLTHLAQAQSLDSIMFFLRTSRKKLDAYVLPVVHISGQ